MTASRVDGRVGVDGCVGVDGRVGVDVTIRGLVRARGEGEHGDIERVTTGGHAVAYHGEREPRGIP